MRNLSPLFTRPGDGFLSTISLTKNQLERITSAKNLIKEGLRSGIASAIKETRGVTIVPRFMSQGSGVYKTRNQPCKLPPQQIDHDFGCYLPLSVHKETGRPDIASEVFFAIVDEILDTIVKENHWRSLDTTKDTCSRVIIDSEIHIDVPLYSIPDREFHTIIENFSTSDRAMRKSISDSKTWGDIESKNVLLAHRKDDWKLSDPRKLNKYFNNAFMFKGEQLRRICRYLKAWRDNIWENGGPSSIFLMTLADDLFGAEIKSRDDLALLDILKGISILKERMIKNPVDPSESLSISERDFSLLKAEASAFSISLEKAIMEPVTSTDACRSVVVHLGDRFPIVPDLPFDPAEVRRIVASTPVQVVSDRRPNDRGRAG